MTRKKNGKVEESQPAKKKNRFSNLGIDKHVTFVYTLYIIQTVIHVRADKEVKKNAVEAAKDLGLSLSDVINAALRNFIRTREVIFSDAPQMTPELEKYLGKIEEDIKHNRNIVGPFHTADEFIEYLNSK